MQDLALIPDRLSTNYTDLISTLDVRVIIRVDDNDYQGDTRLLITDGSRVGILIYGWGSCSGCDAFEAVVDDPAGLAELQKKLWNDIHWEPSPAAMLAYVDGKDWQLDWSWHEASGRAFLDKARAWLAAEVSA